MAIIGGPDVEDDMEGLCTMLLAGESLEALFLRIPTGGAAMAGGGPAIVA